MNVELIVLVVKKEMNGRNNTKPGFKKDEEPIQLESNVTATIQKPAMSTKKKQILKKNVSHLSPCELFDMTLKVKKQCCLFEESKH